MAVRARRALARAGPLDLDRTRELAVVLNLALSDSGCLTQELDIAGQPAHIHDLGRDWGDAVLIAAVQPGLLVPVALVVAVLGGLLLLLIATMALVAVCSSDPTRQDAAERVHDRLLSALRPREPSTPVSRRRKKTQSADTG